MLRLCCCLYFPFVSVMIKVCAILTFFFYYLSLRVSQEKEELKFKNFTRDKHRITSKLNSYDFPTDWIRKLERLQITFLSKQKHRESDIILDNITLKETRLKGINRMPIVSSYPKARFVLPIAFWFNEHTYDFYTIACTYMSHFVREVLMVICFSLGNDVPITVFANLPCQYV